MAGKGSKSRITNRLAYRDNYDKIKWSTNKNTCKKDCKCDNSCRCHCNGNCDGSCKK